MTARKKFFGTLLLGGLMLMAACSNDNKEIQTVAQGYLDAMGNYKPTEARPYSTQQTCDVTLRFFENILAQTDPAVYANNMPATITLGEVTIEDTLAEVAFHKSTPSMEQDGTLHCVKREGKWWVHEVIAVPGIVQAATDTTLPARTFSDEEIEQMRQNGRQGNSMEAK